MIIADASYTEAEYPTKKGWGHGTFTSCLELARSVNAKQLVFTHHEPVREDAELDAIQEQVERMRRPGDPETVIAREGLEIVL